ncbi:MAG: aminotransferase class III-fold pyridoxal phosphate-dependent enzyme [Bacteroidales bacterium]|nr:aminotransferase class III-fold pyridoxal phosphate-dependent enzyme [Bacteroidales bacterium]
MIAAKNKTLFKTDQSAALGVMKELNEQKKNTFLIPTRFLSVKAAEVAFLFNEYINWGEHEEGKKLYRTFFINSCYEALHGAIKLVRHHVNKSRVLKGKPILVYDSTLEFSLFIDPFKQGMEEALVPNIQIVSTLGEVEQALAGKPAISAVVIRYDLDTLTTTLSAIFEKCRKNGIYTILEDAHIDLSSRQSAIHMLTTKPDIIVTGESLTGYEVPFGAFSMNENMHQPWSMMGNSVLHTSTYGGNNLAIQMVYRNFAEKASFLFMDEKISSHLKKISENNSEVHKAFSTYINPGLYKFLQMLGYDFVTTSAFGSKITVQNLAGEKKELLDCISGGGAVNQGHNPSDLVNEVLQKHDPNIDYWDKLKTVTCKVTPFSHFFPSVSGSSAVENALICALLANKDRKKIVTFSRNFAGKSLISLIATVNKMWTAPFGPLYHNVVYVNPFLPNAGEKLTTILTQNDVALVWFELVQGDSSKEIPSELLNIVNKHKEKSGYLVGIDEVLAGCLRHGRLFSYQGKIENPDIITLSKSLSYSSFPTGMTLTTEEVYKRAKAYMPAVVTFLESHYVNNLGSHIALHSIRKFTSADFQGQVKKVAEILETGMKELADQSPVIREVAGKGHMYMLYYKENFVTKMFGKVGYTFYTFYLCQQFAKATGNLLYMDRCLPPLTLTEAEAKVLISDLKSFFSKKPSMWHLYKFINKMLVASFSK